MRRFIRRCLSLFTRNSAEDDLAREMTAHLGLLEAEHQRRGLSPDEARLAARRAMGSVALAKDLHRDARSFRWIDDLRQDSRHALRNLRQAPGFTFVAVLTVSLGVGANIAIFGLVYQALLKPLPFARPGELVKISTFLPQVADRFDTLPVTAPDFLEFRRANSVFSGLAALTSRDFNLTGSGEPERLHGARVSADIFSLLGVRPERGRHFVAGEDEEGRDAVVVISHTLWERRFGSDPAITRHRRP